MGAMEPPQVPAPCGRRWGTVRFRGPKGGFAALRLFLTGTGDPMDGDRPLFNTFKPIGEDNVANARTGPDTTTLQPQGAEQPPGHRDTHGRVGHCAAKGPSPPGPHPSTPELTFPRGRCPEGSRSPVRGAEHPRGTRCATSSPEPLAALCCRPGPSGVVPTRGGPAAGAGGPARPDEVVVRADAGGAAGRPGRAPRLVPRLHQPQVSAGETEAGDGVAATEGHVALSAAPALGSETGSSTPGSCKGGEGERL